MNDDQTTPPKAPLPLRPEGPSVPPRQPRAVGPQKLPAPVPLTPETIRQNLQTRIRALGKVDLSTLSAAERAVLTALYPSTVSATGVLSFDVYTGALK